MKVGKRVKQIIKAQAGINDCVKIYKIDTKDIFGLDSLDEIELIMQVEEEFGIEISDEEAFKIVIVGDLIKLVKSKL